MPARKIETEIAVGGERQFNDAMKGLNSNLKTLRSDMALCAETFADSEGSIEALTAKQKILNETADQQAAVVEALSTRLKDLEDKGDGASAAADKLRRQLNSATADMLKAQRAAKQNAEALSQAEKAAKTYTPATQKLMAGLRSAQASIVEFASKVVSAAHHVPVLAETLDVISASGKVASTAVKGVGTAVSAVSKPIGTMATAAVAATAAVSALGVVALKSMAGYAKEAAEAAKTAAESGETLTDSQQKWLEYSESLESLDASVLSAKSALGGVLLPMLQDLSTEGAQLLGDFSSEMEDAAGDTARQGEIMSKYIIKAAQLIKTKLPEYAKVGKELISGLGQGLQAAGPELLDTGVDLIMELLDGIIEFAPQLGQAGITLVEKLIDGLIENGPELLTTAVNLVTELVTGLAQAAPDLIPAALNLVTTLITALIAAAPDLLMAGVELVLGIISGINDYLGEIANAAKGIAATIGETFREKAQEFLDIGTNIVKGIWQGISNSYEWIKEKISGWVGDVLQYIRNAFGIASPSRLMRDEVGVWIARGIGVGFSDEMKAVNKQIADSVNTSFDLRNAQVYAGESPRGRYYTSGSGSVINLYFYAKTITQADIDLVVDTVNRRLGEAI